MIRHAHTPGGAFLAAADDVTARAYKHSANARKAQRDPATIAELMLRGERIWREMNPDEYTAAELAAKDAAVRAEIEAATAKVDVA